MIPDTGEFKEIIESMVGSQQENGDSFKIGTIASVNGKPSIRFAGETQPSQKRYAFLGSYYPKVGDRVLLVKTLGTYVVLGKINHNPEFEHGVEIGENENGMYMRFENGWQICYFDVPGAQISEETEFISSGQIHRTRSFNWVFPASFIERAKIATGVQSYARWANGYSNAAGTQAVLVQWSSIDSTSFYTQTVIAFGRWK